MANRCLESILKVFFTYLSTIKSIVAVYFQFWRNGTRMDLQITHTGHRAGHQVNVVSYGQSSNDMPTNTSQCCRHLGEYTESAGSFLAHSQPYKETLEHSAFRIWGISCMKLHLGFACSISSGALTDNIFAVLETSEFFFPQSCQLHA